MKTKRKMITRAVLTFLMAFIIMLGVAQQSYRQTGSSLITIAGTSTMHDWTMTTKEAAYKALFEVNADGTPVKLNSITVTIPAESLKSGKGSMDKNAYNSLKTDKFKQITFQLSSAKITGKTILCSGSLTIAGTTKPIDVEVAYEEKNGALAFKGSKAIKMSEYNVEPPSFMFGSVKTGNDITITIDVTLTPDKL